jgi:hypothetical protein
MRTTRIFLLAALALATLTPSCTLFHRSAKVAPAPPPAPAPKAPTQPPKPRQVSLPAPPQIPPQVPDLERAGPDVPEDELPPPPRRRPRPAHPQQADLPTPAPEPPAAPLPDFEQVLTPEQRQAYVEEIDRNVANAQRTVEALQGRRLSRDQATYLTRIRTFIEQANEARKADLFRARNLSERASVLADDLLKSVQ